MGKKLMKMSGTFGFAGFLGDFRLILLVSIQNLAAFWAKILKKELGQLKF